MSVPDIPIEDLKTAVANSLSSVFQTMLSYDCESQRHDDLTGSRAQMPELGGESMMAVHVGSVGFVGAINGLVYLYMKTDFVSESAEKITGLDPSELDGDMVSDVCGELTNMFSGDELFISTIGVVRHLRVEFLVNGQEVIADLVLANPSAA